jgi:hypothetical protein
MYKSFKVLLALLVLFQLFILGLPGKTFANTQDELTVKAETDAELIVQSLLGEGFEYDPASIVLQNGEESLGSFSGGTNIIGFEQGVILSTGNVNSIPGPNESDSGASTDNGLPGDDQLDAQFDVESEDATYIQFNVKPTSDVISFQYVFSSEEYNEYVNDGYNDVFGLYVNGVNVALLPDGITPVTINNVNLETNSQYFRNNDLVNGAPINTEMDGLTVVLNAQSNVTVGEWATVKLIIADSGDSEYDSNVFIKANSIVSEIVEPGQIKVTGPTENYVTLHREIGSDGTVSVDWVITYKDGTTETGNTLFQDGGTSQNVKVPNFDNAKKFTLVKSYGGATIHETEYEVSLDIIPPVTTSSVAGNISCDENWYSSQVDISFTTNEDATTYFNINGGDWTVYDGNQFSIINDGSYTIEYYSIDLEGNVEDYQTTTFNIDTTSPVTSAATDKVANEFDWYNENVKLSFNVSDAGAGLDYTKYSLDGENWTTYESPITLDEGIHTITYLSYDNACNVEEEKVVTIKIDKTAPNSVVTQTTDENNTSATITIDNSNNTGSEIVEIKWAKGELTKTDFETEGTVLEGATFTLRDNGTYSIYEIDEAGNATVYTTTVSDIVPPELPDTATSSYNYMSIGGLLVVVGLLANYTRRRKSA